MSRSVRVCSRFPTGRLYQYVRLAWVLIYGKVRRSAVVSSVLQPITMWFTKPTSKTRRWNGLHSIGQVVWRRILWNRYRFWDIAGIITEEKQGAWNCRRRTPCWNFHWKHLKWFLEIRSDDEYLFYGIVNKAGNQTLEISELLNQHFFPEDVKFLNDWLDRLRRTAVSTIDINMKCFHRIEGWCQMGAEFRWKWCR